MKHLTTVLLIAVIAVFAWYVFSQSKKTPIAAPGPEAIKSNTTAKEPPVSVGTEIIKETIIKYLPGEPAKPRPIRPNFPGTAVAVRKITGVSSVQAMN